MAVDTSKFFKSKDVKVFPCSYRGNYNTATFDPEARLNTEYNFTHLHSIDETSLSYIIEYNNTTKILKCVIGGYYFEISHINSYNLKNKILAITLKSIILKEDDYIDSERTTFVLASQNAGSIDLDEQEGADYYFTGLSINDSAPSGAAGELKVFLADGSVNLEGLKATVLHGTGTKSTKIGENTDAFGDGSFAEGYVTRAGGNYSHAEGSNTDVGGGSSHAEGVSTLIDQATGAHAEGWKTHITDGANYSHTEGQFTKVNGVAAHAEGGNDEVTEGTQIYTIADGRYSHAEGSGTTASGVGAHAEGKETSAEGEYSHTGGLGTKTTKNYQTVIGKYNIDTDGEFVVGVGTADDARDNELVVNNKNITIKKSLKVINDSDVTKFETTPEKTEITTATNSISGVTNTINGTTNTITGTTNTITSSGTGSTTTITNGNDTSNQSKIDLGRESDQSHKIAITSKKIEVNSTGNTTLTNTNLTTNTTTKINATVNGSTKVDITDNSTEISNNVTKINGATSITLKRSDTNKVLLNSDGITATTNKAVITNGSKGVSVEPKGQGTEIKIDNTLLPNYIKEIILDTAYPIGSIYITADSNAKNTCPIATKLGGTWERIKDTFLYAATDSGDYAFNETIHGSKQLKLVKHTHSREDDVEISVTSNDDLTGWFAFLSKRNNESALSEMIPYASGNHVNVAIASDSSHKDDCFVCGVIDRNYSRVNFNWNHAHSSSVDQQPTFSEEGTVNKTNTDNMPPYICVYVWKRTA